MVLQQVILHIEILSEFLDLHENNFGLYEGRDSPGGHNHPSPILVIVVLTCHR